MNKGRLVNRLLIKIFFVGIILIAFQILCCNQSYAKIHEIIVVTGKNEYMRGEVIKITLRNGSKESIFSHVASMTPIFSIDNFERKNSKGNWDKFLAQCQYPHCIYDIDAPGEIKTGKDASFEWDPLIYIDGKEKHIQAGSGIYRLLVTYQLRKDSNSRNWKWLKEYSNEFIIK